MIRMMGPARVTPNTSAGTTMILRLAMGSVVSGT